MNKCIIVMAAVVGALLGCDSVSESNKTHKVTDKELAEFAFLMNRDFQTPSDNKETIILDRRVLVESDNLKGFWFYTQLNTGAEKKLYRQRLAHITVSSDETHIVQKTYALNEPEKFENAWDKPALLTNMGSSDYESLFNEGCELIWTPAGNDQWDGNVDPKNCVIESKRRNKKIRIGSVSFLSQDLYQTSESGYEMDMTYLWGSKPGELIDLYPKD